MRVPRNRSNSGAHRWRVRYANNRRRNNYGKRRAFAYTRAIMLQVLAVLACALALLGATTAAETGGEGQSGRSRVSDDQLNMALSDKRYLTRQLKCALGEAPCDPVGRRLKSTPASCSLARANRSRAAIIPRARLEIRFRSPTLPSPSSPASGDEPAESRSIFMRRIFGEGGRKSGRDRGITGYLLYDFRTKSGVFSARRDKQLT